MRFLLLDRITAWNPGQGAEAIKNVALSEDFFEDHFPLKPIMPGVLMLEGMSQLSGLLLETSVRKAHDRNIKALLSIVERAKFRRPVYPGDSLRYTAVIESFNEKGGTASVKAHINEELAADCRLIFSFHELDNPRFDAIRAEVLQLWLGRDENDSE